jgi:hypothetical protein
MTSADRPQEPPTALDADHLQNKEKNREEQDKKTANQTVKSGL